MFRILGCCRLAIQHCELNGTEPGRNGPRCSMVDKYHRGGRKMQDTRCLMPDARFCASIFPRYGHGPGNITLPSSSSLYIYSC